MSSSDPRYQVHGPSAPTRILHFTIASSFSRKFLSHPALTSAPGGVDEFVVGQSGYRHDRISWGRVLREYVRAARVLWRGRGTVNRGTLAYCHTTKFALPGILLCRLLGVGRVVYFNHGVPYVGHGGLRGVALRALEALNVMAAHGTLTVSPDMVPLLDPHGRRRDRVLSTTPGSSSGLESSRFVSPPIACRRAADVVSKPNLRFAYAGRLQARKGVYVLLDAWADHVTRFPGDVLVLCGFSKAELEAARPVATTPGLEFAGYVTRMQEIYDGVDVVISPSFHEGFGYTLLEGGARGCAMVSADIPGPRVMFSAWMQGQLFESGSSAALARLLARLSGDRRFLRRAMLLSYRSALRFRTERVTIPRWPRR